MSLVEWNPFRDLDQVSREMGNFLERTPLRFLSGTSSPRIDVYQTNTDVIVKAEIPGISKDDLYIYADENSIRLSGESRRENEFKDEHVYRNERYFGNFSRTIPLPVEIKPENTTAEYRDGILSITAPLAEPAKLKGRRIDIS